MIVTAITAVELRLLSEGLSGLGRALTWEDWLLLMMGLGLPSAFAMLTPILAKPHLRDLEVRQAARRRMRLTARKGKGELQLVRTVGRGTMRESRTGDLDSKCIR